MGEKPRYEYLNIKDIIHKTQKTSFKFIIGTRGRGIHPKFKTDDKVYKIKDSKKKVFTIECIRGWSSKKQCCYYVLKEDHKCFWYEYQLDFFIEQ